MSAGRALPASDLSIASRSTAARRASWSRISRRRSIFASARRRFASCAASTGGVRRRRSLPFLATRVFAFPVKRSRRFARKLAAGGFLERTLAERSTLQLERLRAERNAETTTRLLFAASCSACAGRSATPTPCCRECPRSPLDVHAGVPRRLVRAARRLPWLLATRWHEFASALSATYSLHSITAADIVTLWVVGGVVILIHELGHGFACKYFGGEVRELGFMLLYFQPAFYCNVSDAWSFPDACARLWVTAAGSWIQLVIASLAALVWWAAAPGTVVAGVALAAMLVGGITTLLTNANPLLPLDGYFALPIGGGLGICDIAPLRTSRGGSRRTVFQLGVPEPAAQSFRERRVFLIYGALDVCLCGYHCSSFSASSHLDGSIARWARSASVRSRDGGFLLRRRIAKWGRVTILALRARRPVGKRWTSRPTPHAHGRGRGCRHSRDRAVDAHQFWTIRGSAPVDANGDRRGQRHRGPRVRI